MLDLSKSFGRYEEVTFFGDHQDEKIVYYLPDEVRLAPRTDGREGCEFSMQLFHDNKMEDSSIDDLEDTAGSILQLCVVCVVSPERLQRAFDSLRLAVPAIPSDALLTTPLWTDGSVDLITLDKSSLNKDHEGDMVKAIVSSQRPSFTQGLKGAFNVRYDRVGTQLVCSALKNSQSVVIASYDMQFAAIQPALDLKISASLMRCQETARKNIDADFKIPIEDVAQIDLGAHLEWLTRKMVENGDIKVEVTSLLTSDESKRQVEKLVDEFKERVLHEIFKPSLLDNDDSSGIPEVLSKVMDLAIPLKISFCYKLNSKTLSEEREIAVDYSERTAIVQHHNPKAMILDDSNTAIRDHMDDYVKQVVIGDLWDTQSVDIEMFHDFDNSDDDLELAEILVWKHKDGVKEQVPENDFALPDRTKPLGDFFFSSVDRMMKHNISWLCRDDDDGGYYYQLRFVYSSSLDNYCSPKEIVLPPQLSFARTIAIAPESYMFYRNVPVLTGSVDFTVFDMVEVNVEVKDSDGEPVAKSKRLVLDESHRERSYVLRGKDKTELELWASKVYHFKDKSRAPLKSPSFRLKDYALVIDDPRIVRSVYPVLLGNMDGVEKVMISLTLTSPVLEQPEYESRHMVPTSETPLSLTFYSHKDVVSWTARKVVKTDEGRRKVVALQGGELAVSGLDDWCIDLDAEEAEN